MPTMLPRALGDDRPPDLTSRMWTPFARSNLRIGSYCRLHLTLESGGGARDQKFDRKREIERLGLDGAITSLCACSFIIGLF